jgi:hypothetical protein
MRNRALALLLLIASCFTGWGCNLSLGPVQDTRIVIVHQGEPFRIVENVTVQGVPLDNAACPPTAQDVGGWVAMPEDSWSAVVREINRLKAELGPKAAIGGTGAK